MCCAILFVNLAIDLTSYLPFHYAYYYRRFMDSHFSTGTWALAICVLLSLVDSSSQTCHTVSVNSSFSLQQSLQEILSLSLDTSSEDSPSRERNDSNCSRVELPSGMHYLSTPLIFPARLNGIELVGLGDNVTVTCSYAENDTIGTNYTWYFQQLESVSMTGIHFEMCPSPLRLDTIAEVQITDCSFRFDHNKNYYCPMDASM